VTHCILLESRTTKQHIQIPFNELVVIKDLGAGSFGKVCLGKWNHAHIALKFCKEQGSVDNFLSEIKVMMYEYKEI
jgi:predicted Ser/Thr protein kinase